MWRHHTGTTSCDEEKRWKYERRSFVCHNKAFPCRHICQVRRSRCGFSADPQSTRESRQLQKLHRRCPSSEPNQRHRSPFIPDATEVYLFLSYRTKKYRVPHVYTDPTCSIVYRLLRLKVSTLLQSSNLSVTLDSVIWRIGSATEPFRARDGCESRFQQREHLQTHWVAR